MPLMPAHACSLVWRGTFLFVCLFVLVKRETVPFPFLRKGLFWVRWWSWKRNPTEKRDHNEMIFSQVFFTPKPQILLEILVTLVDFIKCLKVWWIDTPLTFSKKTWQHNGLYHKKASFFLVLIVWLFHIGFHIYTLWKGAEQKTYHVS